MLEKLHSARLFVQVCKQIKRQLASVKKLTSTDHTHSFVPVFHIKSPQTKGKQG